MIEAAIKNIIQRQKKILATNIEVLWLCDENAEFMHTAFESIAQQSVISLNVVNNRYDQYIRLTKYCANSHFSDFSHLKLNILQKKPNQPFHIIIFNIAKERSTTHHILNLITEYIHENNLYKSTNVLFYGKKNQGVKTYYKNSIKKLYYEGTLKKYADDYISHLVLTPKKVVTEKLATDEYSTLRQTSEYSFLFKQEEKKIKILSKPCVFGWKKNDQGTLLLLQHLLQDLEKKDSLPETILDLGCGSGIVVAVLKKIGVSQCYATDNNACAIEATRATLAANKLEAKVYPSDCIQELSIDNQIKIQQKVNLVISNPPFHQGFDIKSNLTEKFVSNSAKVLTPKGRAFFVVNGFIGIEQYLTDYFQRFEILENNKKFKVFIAYV